jgi:hypothetical protein
MTGSHAQTEGDQADLRRELRDLLCRMQIEAIEEQQKVLVLQAEQDPTALERYRGLEQKRTLLRATLRDLSRTGFPLRHLARFFRYFLLFDFFYVNLLSCYNKWKKEAKE